MRKAPHSLDRVLALALEPWAITPPMLAVIAGILGHRLAGHSLDTSALEQRPPAPVPDPGSGAAIIPIHGVIAPRMTALSDISGGATFEQAGQALGEAMARPDVATIILDIDSPGGAVAGATEFAHQVLAARTKKPIIAVAHFQMCSAAYWVGSCATEIVASPSAMLGSIGVYTLHEDLSRMLESLGIVQTYIKAGRFKIDGNDSEPLSDSARTRLQALVDARYGVFVQDVAHGRGRTVEAITQGYGEGTVVTADEALALGMVDRIATLEDTLARVLPGRSAAALTARAHASPLPAVADTPQEPAKATGQDRRRQHREAAAALLALEF